MRHFKGVASRKGREEEVGLERLKRILFEKGMEGLFAELRDPKILNDPFKLFRKLNEICEILDKIKPVRSEDHEY